MQNTHKGFTMVELLIVIFIIGILAQGIMLSNTSATESAEASAIITDLRNMKSAAFMFYADRMGDINVTHGDIDYLKPYMQNPVKFSGGSSNPYKFVIQTGSDATWWVGYDLAQSNKSKQVYKKLADKADSIGLYKDTNYDSDNFFTADDSQVWLVAR